MARRGVLVLLGCAWTLSLAGEASGGDLAGSPTMLAQLRAPVVAQAPVAQQRPRLISLDFKDADINNILRILAEFSGLNIVTSDDVKGKVTVKLANVPWQQALDSVVRAAKLAYVQEGNIIRVDRLENLTKEAEAAFKAEQREVEIDQRRKEAELRLAEQERAAALARQEFEVKRKQLDDQLAALVEEVIQLRYGHVGPKRVYNFNFFTDAPETIEEKGVEDAITGGIKKEEGKSAGLLSPRGSVTVDQRTNSMIVRDIPENLAKIRDFVAKVDRPSPQIQIEARIVEMARDDARTLGVVWGSAFTPRTGANSPVIDVRGGAGPRVTPDTGTTAPPPSTAANFPAVLPPITGFAATPFGLALGWLASNFALDIQLQALEGERRARLISAPSLLTLENHPATMASGTDFPVISTTIVNGVVTSTVEFRDVTTRLAVTPRLIAGEGRLLLNIAVKRESVAQVITAGNTVAPVVNTRSTVTQAEIPDGGTVVIAGLRDSTNQDEKQGLPWLSRIPVLGWLFKNDLTEVRKSELVVFLTAKVAGVPGQAGLAPAQLPATPGAPGPSVTPAAPGPQGQSPKVAPAAGGQVSRAVPAAAPRALPSAAVTPPAPPAPPVARIEPRPVPLGER